MNQENVIMHFIRQAGRDPAAIAIERQHEKVTYAGLMNDSADFQTSFQLQGLKAGHKILILHPLSIDLYAAMLALLSMGCTLVFAEEWNGPSDIAACAQHMKCDAMICSFKIRILTLLHRSLRRLKRISLVKSPWSEERQLLPYQPAERQPALVSFSSGSSGLPKAVIRTHAQLNAQFEALRQHIPLQAGQTICTNFPVVILLNLGLGLHTFISKALKLSNLAKTDFEALYSEIIGKEIICLAFSPFVVDSLSVHLLQQHKKADSVRQILTGGSPFFPAFAAHVQQAFPQALVSVLYGSSEAEPIAFCDARDVIRFQHEQGLYAGKTDPHTDCKIEALDQAGTTENKSGEILVSGDHVVTDYYESPVALAKNKIRLDGKIWHSTGDYGYFDERQHLFLTGKPQYYNGTECLLDAEKKLAAIPGIGRATVLNQIVYIQKHPFADEQAIEKQVRSLFSEVKKVKFMKLPLDKRHHGKIKYEQLS